MLSLSVLAEAASSGSNGWTVSGILIGAVIAFLAGYWRRRGEDLAAHAHFATMLQEQTALRKAIQDVESRFTQSKFIGENELTFRQKQLAELYGPIYGTIKTTGRLWKLWMEGKLSEISPQIKELFWRQNDYIVELLRTKAHLIEGDSVPTCFAKYTTSVTIFNIGTRVGKDGYSPWPISELPEAANPEEFFRHIDETTKLLKRNLDRLYREHGYTIRTGIAGPRDAKIN
jgi:hypothetical protein